MIATLARNYLSELKEMMAGLALEDLESIVEMLFSAYREGGQIFVMGNGGSAATASHFACDVSHLNLELKKRIKVHCLTDEISTILAIANDLSYDSIFSEQLRTLLNPGDVVVAISASGNSPNVIKAVEFSNQMQAISVAFAGFDGGRLAKIARRALVVGGNDMKKIEDVHLILSHIVTLSLKARIEKDRRS
jgi:D-sedoheptulose 7-phosphate isomerase